MGLTQREVPEPRGPVPGGQPGPSGSPCRGRRRPRRPSGGACPPPPLRSLRTGEWSACESLEKITVELFYATYEINVIINIEGYKKQGIYSTINCIRAPPLRSLRTGEIRAFNSIWLKLNDKMDSETVNLETVKFNLVKNHNTAIVCRLGYKLSVILILQLICIILNTSFYIRISNFPLPSLRTGEWSACEAVKKCTIFYTFYLKKFTLFKKYCGKILNI